VSIDCSNCKYFNRKNLCSHGGKQTDNLTIFVNKIYMKTVYATKQCSLYKRKWWKFWIRGDKQIKEIKEFTCKDYAKAIDENREINERQNDGGVR